MMRLRLAPWQLPLLLVLSAPLWHQAVGRFLNLSPAQPVAARQQESAFELQDLIFTQSLLGQDQVVVQARQLRGRDQQSDYELTAAEARRLGDNPARISGGYAAYNPQTGILTVTDTVIVTTSDLEIRTEALRYLSRFETVKGAGEVEMVGQGLRLSGTSFSYRLTDGSLRVGPRVRVQYTPIDQQPKS